MTVELALDSPDFCVMTTMQKCRESSAESGVIFVTLSWFKLRRPSTDASLISWNKAPNTAWRDKGITPRSACCRWNGIQEGGGSI
ncbi:hypothetical protein TNCV_2263931 [Trichonephila clavipes]|nr:hypothetical protein TNCV_2263931 [Trichonephila clavipes]